MPQCILKWLSAEAVRLILPAEEIFANGAATDQAKSVDGKLLVKAVASPKGTVILCSEYSFTSKEGRVKVDLKKEADVVDLENGKIIGRLTPVNNTFPVKLDSNRARLFFVGDPAVLGKSWN